MVHRKKRRTHVKEENLPQHDKKNDPRSFVLRRGRHSLVLKDLEEDIRQVMQPNTAAALKESKKNTLKDFVHVAGPLGVTHFLMLTATEKASYLRCATVPRGPTLTFQIAHYTLTADLAAVMKNYSSPPGIYKTSPLVVLNNFVGEKHLRLAAVVFQNMFPAINVKTVKLATCKRVVLLDYDAESDLVMFRHYQITAQPAGVSKRIRKLVTKRDAPSMKGLGDIADYLGGAASESEGEDTSARVTLAQDLGRANRMATQSALKLQEIGPRIALELVKVEEGVCTGQVLYHKYVEKSTEEVAELIERKETVVELKAQRRKQQEDNIRRKREAKDENRRKERARQGLPERPGDKGSDDSEAEGSDWADGNTTPRSDAEEQDSDTEWYRQEVGDEPDELFKKNVKSRKNAMKESEARVAAKKVQYDMLKRAEERKPGSTKLSQKAALSKKDKKEGKGDGGKRGGGGGDRGVDRQQGGHQAPMSRNGPKGFGKGGKGGNHHMKDERPKGQKRARYEDFQKPEGSKGAKAPRRSGFK